MKRNKVKQYPSCQSFDFTVRYTLVNEDGRFTCPSDWHKKVIIAAEEEERRLLP